MRFAISSYFAIMISGMIYGLYIWAIYGFGCVDDIPKKGRKGGGISHEILWRFLNQRRDHEVWGIWNKLQQGCSLPECLNQI